MDLIITQASPSSSEIKDDAVKKYADNIPHTFSSKDGILTKVYGTFLTLYVYISA